MVHLFYFSSLFTAILAVLVTGILFSYTLMLVHNNSLNNSTVLNFIKWVLILTLSVSFLLYIIFIYFFYKYYCLNLNYSIFSTYSIIPKLSVNIYFYFFEFSIDFFGIIILFLAYFVGLLSLLALDNRLHYKNEKYLFVINIFLLFVFFFCFFIKFFTIFFILWIVINTFIFSSLLY